jgi:spermidine synthase
MHVSDGRSFVRNSRDRYDVVQMTLVDTWASTAAGAFALGSTPKPGTSDPDRKMP